MDINGVYNITESVRNIYSQIISPIPEKYRILVSLFFLTILIALYAIFIWKFYRFLAKRDILELNLAQYNKSTHHILNKLYASLFFILEYIIIAPLIVFFWFCILSVFLMVMTKSTSIEQILLISAAVVAATRITSYFEEDLSKDIAKLFPLTAIVIFLLEPDFFKMNIILERIVGIPSLLTHIIIFLIFIVALEIILRLVFLAIDFWTSEEEIEEIKRAKKAMEEQENKVFFLKPKIIRTR